MARPKPTHFVVTAVSTDTGAPLYWQGSGMWSGRLSEAMPISGREACDVELAEASRQERVVCDPYAMPILVAGAEFDPLTTREKIRSLGPTTRLRRPDSAR